jgi:hypothetical protein
VLIVWVVRWLLKSRENHGTDPATE